MSNNHPIRGRGETASPLQGLVWTVGALRQRFDEWIRDHPETMDIDGAVLLAVKAEFSDDLAAEDGSNLRAILLEPADLRTVIKQGWYILIRKDTSTALHAADVWMTLNAEKKPLRRESSTGGLKRSGRFPSGQARARQSASSGCLHSVSNDSTCTTSASVIQRANRLKSCQVFYGCPGVVRPLRGAVIVVQGCVYASCNPSAKDLAGGDANCGAQFALDWLWLSGERVCPHCAESEVC